MQESEFGGLAPLGRLLTKMRTNLILNALLLLNVTAVPHERGNSVLSISALVVVASLVCVHSWIRFLVVGQIKPMGAISLLRTATCLNCAAAVQPISQIQQCDIRSAAFVFFLPIITNISI
jgi:hypothetical protein